MSARLQSVLDDLRDRYGATASDLTADELVALVHACERVDSPYSQIDAELVGRPVYVCPGVWFWPVTAGAAVWLEEFASGWWPRGSRMFRWAQVYALRNGRDRTAFENLTEKGSARLAILRCALSLCCHRAEVMDAMNRAYGIARHDAPPREDAALADRAKTDFAGIVARLEVGSGIRRDEWLWGRSVASLMKSYVEQTELAVAAFGGKRERETIELDEAIGNLARTCAAIGERLSGKVKA